MSSLRPALADGVLSQYRQLFLYESTESSLIEISSKEKKREKKESLVKTCCDYQAMASVFKG